MGLNSTLFSEFSPYSPPLEQSELLFVPPYTVPGLCRDGGAPAIDFKGATPKLLTWKTCATANLTFLEGASTQAELLHWELPVAN